MIRKLRMVLLSVLVFIMPFSKVYAEEHEAEAFVGTILVDEGQISELEEGISQDECLQGYFEQRLYGVHGIETFAFFSLRDTLNSFEQMVYDAYKEQIESIAAGRSSETLLTLSAADFIPQMRFSAAELGVERILGDDRRLLDEAYEAFMETIEVPEYDAEKVALALRFDCVFDCCWADLQYKVQQPVSSVKYGVSWDGEEFIYTDGSFQFGFYAAKDFRLNSHTVDTRKMSSVNTAAETAASIVAEAEGMGDYEKLRYYAETICALTDYNEDAALPGYLVSKGYGNPWQPIYVFDNDPSTRVVCEGYAKAFKYLVDLSVFADENIYASVVTGDLIRANGGRISHMWNVVHMDDGRNYLVDVTNMDRPEGIREHLFISHYAELNEDGSYTFADEDSGYQYGLKYDAETMGLYIPEELAVSAEPYTLPHLNCRIEEVFASLEERMALNCMIQVQHPEFLGSENGQAYADIQIGSDVSSAWRMEIKPEDCQNNQVLISVPVDAGKTDVPVKISLWVNGTEAEMIQKSCAECLEELARVNDTLKMQKLADAALSYGAYADAYFSKKTIQGLEEEIDLSGYYAVLSHRGHGAIRLCSASLLLKDQVAVRVYFTLADGYQIEDFSFHLDGQEADSRVRRMSDGRYYLETEGFRADELMRYFHLQVTWNGEEAADLQYSPMSYVEAAERRTIPVNLRNLVKALYLYAAAAAEYSGQ